MLEGSCHCQAVRFRVPAAPPYVNSCNCSLCRRLNVLMAAYPTSDVEFLCGKDATVAYIQGDKTLALHHCTTCGCTTHWTGLGEYAHLSKVNALLFDPEILATLRVRRFDGANTWTYLDD